MLSPSRGRTLAALLLLGVLAPACTEPDKLFEPIGTARVLFVDPALQVQRIKDPEPPIQYAAWQILNAFYRPGNENYDLAIENDPCSSVDRATLLFPETQGKCEAGVVIAAADEASPLKLDVKFTMEVRRAKPVDLPPAGDYDGDGLPNGSDPCPLLRTARGDQLDYSIDLCSVEIDEEIFSDHDGDGIIDALDNCVWLPNPNQVERRPADGIGDACTTQRADVFLDSLSLIELELGPQDFAQPLFVQSFLVVDTSSTRALDCDWDAGRCVLNREAVRFCTASDALSASLGCP